MSLSLHLLSRLSALATRPAQRLPVAVACQRWMSGSELGRGAGKGGGAGGSIREAGGSLGKSQAAKEEEYFRRLQQEQLAGIRHRLADEVAHHEQEISHHLEAIRKHKASMAELGGHKHDKDKKH